MQIWDIATGAATFFQLIVSSYKADKVRAVLICVCFVLVVIIIYILIEGRQDSNAGEGNTRGRITTPVNTNEDDTTEPQDQGGMKPSGGSRDPDASPPVVVDVDGLKKEIVKLKTEIGKFIESDEESQKQIQWLQTQNEGLNEKNDTLQTQNKAFGEEKYSLKTQNNKLNKKNDALQTRNEELNKKNGSLQARNEVLGEENYSLKTQNDKFDRENKSLRRNNEILHSEKQQLQADKTVLQEQLSDCEDNYDPPTPKPVDPAHLPKEPPQDIFHDKSSGVMPTARSKNNQGYIAFYKNNFGKATDLFIDGIQADPKAAAIHYNLGCTYLETSNYAEAVKSFNEAVRFGSNYKETYYNLAIAYFGNDNPQEAIKAANKALKIDQNYQKAQEILTVLIVIE